MKTNMQTGPAVGGSREGHFEKREEALANEQLSTTAEGRLRRAEFPGMGVGRVKVGCDRGGEAGGAGVGLVNL